MKIHKSALAILLILSTFLGYWVAVRYLPDTPLTKSDLAGIMILILGGFINTFVIITPASLLLKSVGGNGETKEKVFLGYTVVVIWVLFISFIEFIAGFPDIRGSM